MRSNLTIWKSLLHLIWTYHKSLQTNLLRILNISTPISWRLYSYNHLGNYHNSSNTCLPCTLKETPYFKFENFGLLLDQHFIYPSFYQFFQCFSTNSTRCPRDKTLKETVHFFNTKIIHPYKIQKSNVKLNQIFKLYYVIYNDRAGGGITSKCQWG